MTDKRPNFFIVGTARSGTTALGRYLAEHPQIYMSPIKEPSYFAPDIVSMARSDSWEENQRGLEAYLNGPMRHRRGGCVLDWNDYLKLFRNVSDESAIGEASTAYLISQAAPGEIRTAIPHARILMILRNPIERAFSTFLMFRNSGKLRRSFGEVLRNDSDTADWRHLILETRKIADGVERFLTTFPRGQVHWNFHEELSSDPLVAVRSIYAFLDVDPAFNPDVSKRYNESIVPRVPRLDRALHTSGLRNIAGRVVPSVVRPLLRNAVFHRMHRESLRATDRAFLADYFREDVNALSSLVKTDLSRWLEPD